MDGFYNQRAVIRSFPYPFLSLPPPPPQEVVMILVNKNTKIGLSVWICQLSITCSNCNRTIWSTLGTFQDIISSPYLNLYYWESETHEAKNTIGFLPSKKWHIDKVVSMAQVIFLVLFKTNFVLCLNQSLLMSILTTFGFLSIRAHPFETHIV